MGKTWVLCAASIEEKVPQFLEHQGGGWIKASYSLLPRSTHTRSPREATTAGGRTHEIQRIIGRSLRAGVDLTQLDGYTVYLDCDVIQADGGTRTAAITGAWLALRQAFRFLYGNCLPSGLLKTELIAAVSVGMINDELLLDLDYEEDHSAAIDMNVVMTKEANFAEIQCTAEHGLIDPYHFQAMLDLAKLGIQFLFTFQEIIIASLWG